MNTDIEKQRLIKSIRQITAGAQPQNCHICGQYKFICHQHHILPVSKTADYIIQHNLYGQKFTISVVWLCPNHHTLLHLLRSGRENAKTQFAYTVQDQDERGKLLELSQLMDKAAKDFNPNPDFNEAVKQILSIDY
jgi:hypothetical protein